MTHLPLAQLATRVMLGEKLVDMGFETGLIPADDMVHVKAPIFSFTKLPDVDSLLGPEMKSTGEVMGSDTTLPKALYKAFVASNIKVPQYGNVLFTVADADKAEAINLAKRFNNLGFALFATSGTGAHFAEQNLPVDILDKIAESDNNSVAALRSQRLQVVINTTQADDRAESDGRLIRNAAIENAVPLFTALDTVSAFLDVLESRSFTVNEMK